MSEARSALSTRRRCRATPGRRPSPGCRGSTRSGAADVAVLGVPFDSGVSYRPGARFGPRTSGSPRGCCGPTTPRWTSRRSRAQQVADAGDLAVNPFDIDEAIARDRARRGGHARATPPGCSRSAATTRSRCRCCAPGASARPGGGAALRRAPRHLGHLLRRAVHARHAVPPRLRGGPDRPASARCTSASAARSTPTPTSRSRPGSATPPSRAPTTTGSVSTASIAAMRERLGDGPVYVSVDIDVLDPGMAPGTGTPEAGGLTSRELLATLRGLRRARRRLGRHRRGRAGVRPRRGHRHRRGPRGVTSCWRDGTLTSAMSRTRADVRSRTRRARPRGPVHRLRAARRAARQAVAPRPAVVHEQRPDRHPRGRRGQRHRGRQPDLEPASRSSLGVAARHVLHGVPLGAGPAARAAADDPVAAAVRLRRRDPGLAVRLPAVRRLQRLQQHPGRPSP